jgi:N-acetylglucosamine-6-phosphate deacetylase
MTAQLGGIACRRLYTPHMILDNVLVLFEGAKIGMMGDFNSAWVPPDVFNARGEDLTVVPGFIDVHIHGCGGSDFREHTDEAFRTISTTAAGGGATSIVATTTFPQGPAGLEMFEEVVRAYRASEPPGARFLGLFLEGPFINPEMRGGFGADYVQPVRLEVVRRILDLCADLLLKITIAPEIEQGEELINMVHDNPGTQIEVSLGHSSADFALARKFFKLERVRQVTHAFNAMTPFHHRSPSLIGAALLDDRVMMEMIPDGCHLVGPTVEMLYRAKGPKRLMIITDGTAATATPEGTPVRSVGGITMVRDGAVRLENGALAGSNLLMAGAVRRAMDIGAVPFEHAVEMASMTPAVSVRREAQVGSIDPGKFADLCVLRRDGSVAATIRDGRLVYQG